VSRSTRQAGHTAANAVVVAYLLAAAVRIAVHTPDVAPDWLLVHLLLLGALTNAIVTWSSHFAIALLQQPQLPAAVPLVRLVVLNAAVIGTLVGVSDGSRPVTVSGAALLTLVVLAHLAALVRIGQAGRKKRFAPTVRFYWSAAVALLLGVSAGVTMAVADLPAAWYERVYLAHVHLNLFGWITLTVLGTLFTLWPTALRTRMVTGLERASLVCLLCCAGGLALAVGGLLSWTRPLAIAGLLLYCVGVVAFLDPFLRTARRRAPHDPATLLLAAGTGWLLAGLGYDVVALVRDADPYALAADAGDLAPWLLTGFAVQVLLGALGYLVPVVLGGPPSVTRRTAAAMSRLGMVPVAPLNAGVLLLALPESSLSRAAWPLVAAALVVFAGSVGAAVVARARARPAG
jgi:nitrite reductase (NO-forming)